MKLFGHDQPVRPPTSIEAEDIRNAVADEMCMTAEDYLSRRTRHLLLDAKSAIAAAPQVVKIMANKMEKDENWIREQVNEFTLLAQQYLPQTINNAQLTESQGRPAEKKQIIN